jgi:hypothetical protein
MRNFLLIALLAFPAAVWAAEAPPEEETRTDYPIVVLQGLNKVTGHISRFEGPVGSVLRFGSLEITARRCWKAPPEERPENAALLEISELKPDEETAQIFMGWMFSSSPGLSGLEHAVYDITVLSCEEKTEAAAEKEKEKPADEKKEPPKEEKKETPAVKSKP